MQEDKESGPYIQCRPIERQEHAAAERARWQWGVERGGGGIIPALAGEVR